eukprot:TRINITY_DN7493_c0_g1_i2.p1 TRINITY_DN7493_c0_g1~~TRINITY_DN7493_c0_g1_i2.p1  ORF type:complete len:219 (+),score=40.12 TRINITY_DN7493_c0_g1_i2:494-1150(+)
MNRIKKKIRKNHLKLREFHDQDLDQKKLNLIANNNYHIHKDLAFSYKYDSDYSEKQNSAEKIIRKKSAKSSNSNDAKEIKISEKKQSKKNTNNNNDQLETNQQTTYEISKDFAYKLYNASENIIQLSSLIPIELLNKFQEKQNSIEEKSGAKILFESEKLYYFANNEQQCFLIKILGTSSQYIQTLKIIFNLLNDKPCLLYTSPSPRDRQKSRMPSSA